MKRTIRTPYFEIGTKNYIWGDKVLEYAQAADRAAEKYDIDVLFITTPVELRRVVENTKHLIVLAPYMDTLRPGRVIASGTTEELKKMIKTGETITVEALLLTEKQLQDIRNLPHVFDVHYENQILTLRCTGAQHNLIRILNYLQSQNLTFGRVLSELPTLNDVFLEITGKQLRD